MSRATSSFAVLLGLLLVLGGCATTQGARQTSDGWMVRMVRAGNTEHKVSWITGSPGASWQRDPARTADVAWTHRDLAATIYSDTTCGSRYDDVPLTVLVNHLTFGFEDLKTEEQVEVDLAVLGALRRVFSATLDGRPVKLASTVIKKGPCIFDLVYVTAQPDRFTDGWDAYMAVLDGLAIRVAR